MFRNILSNWSFLIFSILSVFLLYPFCVRILGEEQYGVWLLISSVTGYFAILQAGVPMANVRFVSKYHAQGETIKVNEVISSNAVFFTVIGFIVLLSGFGIAYIIDEVFQVSKEYKKIAKIVILIVSLNISLSFIFEVFEGILHAFQEFVLFNIIKIVLLITRVSLTFLILRFENGLFVLAILLLLVTIIQALVFLIYIRLKYPKIRIKKKHVRFDVFKKVAGYSVFVLISNFAYKLSFNTDAMVVGSVVSISAIVSFTIANNFILYSMNFASGISNVLMPMISKIDALDGMVDLKEKYIKYSKFTSFCVIPLCAFFLILGGDFISIWMGENYRIVSGNILSILTLSYIFLFVQYSISFPILMGSSLIRFPTLLMLATAIANLLLSIWWGKIFGVYGVAWGTTLPNLIYSFGIMLYMCKWQKMSFKSYFIKTIFVPLSAGIFFAFPALILKKYLYVDSYTMLSMIVSVSSGIYFFILYFFYIEEDIKKDIKEKIKFFWLSIKLKG